MYFLVIIVFATCFAKCTNGDGSSRTENDLQPLRRELEPAWCCVVFARVASSTGMSTRTWYCSSWQRLLNWFRQSSSLPRLSSMSTECNEISAFYVMSCDLWQLSRLLWTPCFNAVTSDNHLNRGYIILWLKLSELTGLVTMMLQRVALVLIRQRQLAHIYSILYTCIAIKFNGICW